jgi:DNA mismatch repair protein MutL
MNGSKSLSKISILPPLIAERIAAGEVIERPASVVKELVENAIDAGATQIEVRLNKGGCDLIEVLDDGKGMDRDDLEICVCRHATSKIKEFDDLTHLASLGFRGEALPSIASVAELTITSRVQTPELSPTDSSAGHTFEIKAAHTAPAKANAERVANYNFLGMAHGTRVRVASLFSQIPARLKFLKSPGAESSAVREILERLALTHPEVRFALSSDDRKLLDLPIEALSKRAERMLGDGNPFELLETKIEGAWGIEIIWLKNLSLPHTRSMYQIVNGRALRDRILQTAILNPLRQSFLPGHFPAIVVKLDIPPEEIDVNVHPTKTEIRFLDSKKIFALCNAAIEKILIDSTPSEFWLGKSAGTPASASMSAYSPAFRASSAYSQAYLTPSSVGGASLPSSENFSHSGNESAREGNSSGWTSSLSPIESTNGLGQSPSGNFVSDFSFDTTPFGQFKDILFSTYFVFEQGDELLLVDQHAAHERIRYEKLKNSVLRQEKIEMQELLVPEVTKLDSEKVTALKEKISLLPQLGFDAEIFSEEAILFRSVPAVWGMNQLGTRLKNLLERLLEIDIDLTRSHPVSQEKVTSQQKLAIESLTWDEVLFEKVAMEACRSSYKAGDHMDERGAIDLTQKLMNCEHPGNCPHGRPTFIKISKFKVEEWFSRKI